MIDRRLLQLENFINDRNDQYDLNDIAEVLQISERQLVRQLNNWQQEGYIDYLPGKGRGNTIQIDMLVNVEQETLKDILKEIHDKKFEEIQEYINFPWHQQSIHTIQQTINEYLNEKNLIQHSIYTEYIPSIPDTLHPAYLNDSAASQIAYQVFESLYIVTKNGRIKRNLLRYDEWQHNDLHMYLKKDIRFSNGSLFVADDVRRCLEKLMNESLYAPIFTVIEHIQVIDDYYLILKFNKKPKYFEYTLASRYSAIYKQLVGDEIVGTGPYYIQSSDKEHLTLAYNSYYRGDYPDVEEVRLVTGDTPSTLMDDTYSYYVSVGEDFLLFNPHRSLTINQRAFIADVFTVLLSDAIDLKREVIVSHMKNHPLPSIDECPEFEVPVKVIANEMTLNFFLKMKEVLARYKVELQIIEMTHMDYLNTHLLNVDVDFIWMYENYHSIQPYKTIDLLTQCKFQEWYGVQKEADDFMNNHHYRPNEEHHIVAQQFIRKLERQQLMIPLLTNRKEIILPEKIKNVHQHAYGTVDYHKMMIDH